MTPFEQGLALGLSLGFIAGLVGAVVASYFLSEDEGHE